MRKNLILAILAAFSFSVTGASAQEYAPAGDRIKTRWAAEVSPQNAHPEYPRPQMVRPRWQSLNGLWNYAVTGDSVSSKRCGR